MSCPECCTWCCPCLSSSKKTSKFSSVRYTRQKISDDVQPGKVFEFPQNKSDFNTHPQMFVEAMAVVRDQPTNVVGHQPTSVVGYHPTSVAGYHPTSVAGYQPTSYHPMSVVGYHPTSVVGHHPTSVVGCQPVPKLHLDDTVGTKLDVYGYDALGSNRPHFSHSEKPNLQMTSLSEDSDKECEQLQPPVSPQRKWDSHLAVRRPVSPFALPMLEESSLQHECQLPVLQFSLLFDIQRNIFTVHLHHASNLPENDRRGTMNPFVVIYMMPTKEEVFESDVLYRTLNPEFYQSFEFHQQHPDDIQQKTLIFKVYDNSRSKFIGGVAFPLEGADIFGVVMRMQIDHDMSEVFQDSIGDVLLALSYDQSSSSVKGVFVKAINLIKHDLWGSADPYVKIYIYHKNTRISKWKSTVKKNTLVPIFNESFHFEINERDIESISLKLVVMDYDRFSRNDVMGTVLIGSCVSNESGCKHWKEMILNPNSSVCQWHTII